MKLEKNQFQALSSVGEYLAPEVMVMEINNRKMICASDGGYTEDSGEGDTGGWF